MERGARRNWLIGAIFPFLVTLVIWACTAIWLVFASGDNISFTSNLRSQLRADYGVDGILRSIRTLRLSLFEDLLRDLGLRVDLPNTLGDLFQGPAAAAPAPDLVGSPSFSATPGQAASATYTPTLTPLPSSPPPPAATSTQAPSPTEVPALPSPTTKPMQVSPILECVVNNRDGTFTAHFGYENPNVFSVEIPIGPDNYLSPAPDDRGQPGTFQPGRTSGFPSAGFTVTFSGRSLKWNLNGLTAYASKSSSTCGPGPSEPDTTDTQPPQILGAVLNPAPGAMEACTVSVSASGLHVFDPNYSAGLKIVKLKYKVVGYTDYIYSDPLVLESGGFTPNGDWAGYYAGTIDLCIDSGWSSPAPDVFHVELWAKAADHAGNWGYVLLGEYTFPATCGSAGDDD
ncbi:MAG TPA: hypothetical protein VJ123_04770 [Anaerolineales bacterium]|nr:hypothetical protein [Anaerolineales bacterium]